MLRLQIALLDLNATLQSSIATSSALRAGHASRLSASLQLTLDGLRDAIADLRSEMQATRTSVAPRRQRLENELQRREGRLGVALGEFRARIEAAKLRAIYTFTMGIAVIFLAIVAERTQKSRKGANGSGVSERDL